MTVTNRVSAELSDEIITEVLGLLKSVETKIPFMLDLSKEEIKALPRFGDKSIAFVEKALELSAQMEDFLPRNFSIQEFRKDVNLYAKLYSILQPLRMLAEKVEDTYIQVGAEAYSSALVVYASGKLNKDVLPGLSSALDELGKRFIKKGGIIEEEKIA